MLAGGGKPTAELNPFPAKGSFQAGSRLGAGGHVLEGAVEAPLLCLAGSEWVEGCFCRCWPFVYKQNRLLQTAVLMHHPNYGHAECQPREEAGYEAL